MDSHHPHQTIGDNNRGIREDFSFTENDDDESNNGNSLLLSAAAKAVVEMTPADDIFFHGHLLPLHLLSHFTPLSSPSGYYSESEDDSFTLPIEGYSPATNEDGNFNKSNFKGRCGNRIHSETETVRRAASPSDMRERDKKYSKPSSLFGLPRRRRAGEAQGQGDEGSQGKQKRKFWFDLNRAVKKYVRPLLFFGRRSRRKDDAESEAQTSTQGDSRGTKSTGMVFSAPASIRTSPRNSGLLVTRPTLTTLSASDVTDSTVEELQAAIQAAIAYCKKSIAADQEEEGKLLQT